MVLGFLRRKLKVVRTSVLLPVYLLRRPPAIPYDRPPSASSGMTGGCPSSSMRLLRLLLGVSQGPRRPSAAQGIMNARFGTMSIKGKGETKGIQTWTGMSHGNHMVEKEGDFEGYVLAQREQVEDSEFWLFGIFDHRIGARFTKYLQTHLFENKLSKFQIENQVEQIMKRAYLSTKANIEVGESMSNVNGFATTLVMNSNEFVAAYIGEYKVVACMDGMAVQMGEKYMKRKRRWHGFIGIICAPNDGAQKPDSSSKIIISTTKVEPNTNFIILASDGVWEVMSNQEAVDLVYHIENAQAAAEYLAEEALNRMSKSVISCIVIRFH